MRLRLLASVLAACAAAIVPGSAGAAQVAASIEYDFVPRPAGLPEDMQPLPGAALRFLHITALDGYRLTAALWQPEGRAPAETPILVQVHGSGSNLAELPLRAVARALSAKDHAALAISTRQHDEHVNTDNFFDVRRDIEAAVAVAKALGHRAVILEGHSLGTIQVEYYAATDWDPAIRAVILTGPFGKLPWKSRNILVQDEANYKALGEAARAALAQEKIAEIMPVRMRWLGGLETKVTAQHFLTYRDERSSAADGTYWVPRIPHPILMLRDQADGVVLPFEPYMLLSAAHQDGSLVQGIEYVLVPDARPPSAAGHTFTDNTAPLVEAVSGWLAERHL